MKQLFYKSIFAALFLFAGTLAAAEQKTKISAEDVFEITYERNHDAQKPSKYEPLLDIKSAVFLSQINDDVLYIELKVHNKSAHDIEIWSKDFRATMVVMIVGADGMPIVRGTPGILELLGDKLPMLIKPGENAMFLLMLKHIKRWNRLNITVDLFDLSEDINLKKK